VKLTRAVCVRKTASRTTSSTLLLPTGAVAETTPPMLPELASTTDSPSGRPVAENSSGLQKSDDAAAASVTDAPFADVWLPGLVRLIAVPVTAIGSSCAAGIGTKAVTPGARQSTRSDPFGALPAWSTLSA
jgi:hypothetical protein